MKSFFQSTNDCAPISANMSRSPTHGHRRWKRRASLVFVFLCDLVLCGFYAFHRISKSDDLYGVEIMVAWSLAVSGVYFGIRAYQRGKANQRVAAALAMIISSILLITLFSSYSDSPPGIPQPSDSGANGS